MPYYLCRTQNVDALLASSVTGGREGLLQLDAPQEEVLQGQKSEQHAVAQPSNQDNNRSSHSIEPVVVCCSNNNREDKGRVQDTQCHEEHLPHLAETLLT